MLKRILIALGVVLSVVFVTISLPIASVGRPLYAWVSSFESSSYGLGTHVVEVSDTRLVFYQSALDPERETVVLLHGFSSDRFIFARFAKHLTQDFNVVIPDLAGHGESPYVDGISYAPSAQARRVAELLDALEIERVHIAGNSMGGAISAHFAILYPERTLSAGLIDPAGVDSPIPSDMGKMLDQGRNPFEVNSHDEFHEFYAMTMHRPPYLPGAILAAIADDYQARRPQLQTMFSRFHGQEPLDERLGELRAPTLIMWGDRDRLLHVSAGHVWLEGLPNAQLVVFQEIGHMPQFEVPKESAATYRAFLAGLDR